MDRNTISVIYGKDPFEMATKLMQDCDLAALIGDRNRKIAIKPNLITSTTADHGAVTHPEIVIAIIEYLQSQGFNNIKIIESSWVGDNTKRAFAVNGYNQISARYNVPLVDVKQDSYEPVSVEGIKIEISKEALKTDFLINVPVLKGHCQTLMTCALKNMKGVLSDRSKRAFHSMGLSKPIAALNKAKKQDFILVDNINGDLDFEEAYKNYYEQASEVCRQVALQGLECAILGTEGADSWQLLETAGEFANGLYITTNMNSASAKER